MFPKQQTQPSPIYNQQDFYIIFKDPKKTYSTSKPPAQTKNQPIAQTRTRLGHLHKSTLNPPDLYSTEQQCEPDTLHNYDKQCRRHSHPIFW